ncbi:MAG: hypothetical protein AAF928_20125, partial [Myxococcota bacterium]
MATLLLLCLLAACADEDRATEASSALARDLAMRVEEARPPPADVGPPALPADQHLTRATRSRFRSVVGGHILYVPEHLSAPDGAFDLLVAFHTHRPILFESVERAGLNAVVANVNLGEGAGRYERVFSHPTAFATLLANVLPELEARGLARPRVRRVGLLSWSAGFGAVRNILAQPHADRVDFVAVLDGLHAHLIPETTTRLFPADLDVYVEFAERAIGGEAAFIVTHNHIVPEAMPIASVTRTTDAVLRRLGLQRKPAHLVVTPPRLDANDGVYSDAHTFALELETEVRRGGLTVLGFAGRDEEAHICHLMAMVPLALEPLRGRWASRQNEPVAIGGTTTTTTTVPLSA